MVRIFVLRILQNVLFAQSEKIAQDIHGMRESVKSKKAWAMNLASLAVSFFKGRKNKRKEKL